MFSKQFRELKKVMRREAKKNKMIKYSLSLLLMYLMTGRFAISSGLETRIYQNTDQTIVQSQPVSQDYNSLDDLNKLILSQDKAISDTVTDLRNQFKIAKRENDKLIRNSNLQLVQLMEQGDQVVKSTWNSWQFGLNYFYNSWNGVYKGHGDKTEKYYFNNIFTRYNWKIRNAMNVSSSNSITSTPITPGSEDTTTWTATTNVSGTSFDLRGYRSLYSSVNGYSNWGLVDLIDVAKNIASIEMLAKIEPKDIQKTFDPITVAVETPSTVNSPEVNPTITPPIDAPVINIPEVETITINPLTITPPNSPTQSQPANINITVTDPSSPTITPLSVITPSEVEMPNIKIFVITPVDFVIDPTGDSLRYKSNTWSFNANPLNVTELSNRNYVTLNTVNSTVNVPSNQVINVTASNNRALVVDEARNNAVVNYAGTINLTKSQNVGIDLQGTHGGSTTSPWLLTVNNSGNIIGEAKSGSDINENHIAFGFNNADASDNTTMSYMINSVTITLNAKNSAAIQLKPEDPNYWRPISWNAAPLVIGSNRTPSRNTGRVLMKAENSGTITLNSLGSFGILTVFNKGVKPNDTTYNLLSGRLYGNVLITPGGEIGRSALTDSKFTSGIYNTGTITITGDNSIGVGLLQEIQEVKIGGTVNIGEDTDASQENGISNSTGKDTTKVEESVGVFAGVPTWPVRIGENDTLISNNNGNTATQLTGTETVEIEGTINIKKKATSSIGALVGYTEVSLNNGLENGVQTTEGRTYKRSGDITIKSSGTINVDGEKNYGLVINNYAYSSKFTDASNPDNMTSTISKTDTGIGVNEGTINVTGKESVGIALIKGGNSTNDGTIEVRGDATKSIGFYGEEDIFTNSGTIQITTNTSNKDSENKAVLLNGTNAKNKIIFNNISGTISVNTQTNTNGKSNIGVSGTGNYEFNYISGAINVGSDAIGLYLKDATGVANIYGNITLSNSNDGTTIGIYSDGNAQVTFYEKSNLNIGTGAVGLYSQDASKFTNTFKINSGDKLNVSLGDKSTFALLDGKNTTSTINLSSYLNNNGTDKINITSMGQGASIFYAKSLAEALLDADYTISNGGNDSTMVLIATDSGIVTIDTGKKLTTNTHAGLVATAGATAKNKGTLISTRDAGVGIYTDNANGENNGTITMNTASSTALYGVNNSTINNTKDINLEKTSSVGIYAKDSNATSSSGTITLKEGSSVGIYGLLISKANVDKTISNVGVINLDAGASFSQSAGIYAKADKDSTGTLTGNNSGEINIYQGQSAGLYAKNETNTIDRVIVNNTGILNVNADSSAGIFAESYTNATNSGRTSVSTSGSKDEKGIFVKGKQSAGILAKANAKVTNSGDITLENNGDGLIGISSNKATVENTGNITVKSKYSVGIYDESGTVNNSGTILTDTVTPANSNEGIVAISLDGSTATNSGKSGTITLNTPYSVGVYAYNSSEFDNSGSIAVEKSDSVGIFAYNTNGKTVKNSTTGTITLKADNGVGIYAKNNGLSDRVVNEGTITLDIDTTGTATSQIGMLALTDTNEETSISNKGTINVNTTRSSGMYAINNLSKDKLKISNEGKIFINNGNSAAIYAQNSTVESIGNITLANSADRSAAVYLSEGTIATTLEDAVISLGTKNQNRVAYYIKDNYTSIKGTSIGKISGYGVGVYLDGTSYSTKLYSDTPELDYTLNGMTGDGIIGLLLKGNTDISGYTNKIKVGSTVGNNYGIGIYSDNQGTTTTPYTISNDITTGAKGVGIFVAESSVLEYNGTMTIGDGTDSGIGFYVTKPTPSGNTSKVSLDSNAVITLDGNNGVVAIVSEDAEFDGGNATINLNGSGVGVYGLKGSTISISNWTFNNNGNKAEEMRVKEGLVTISSNRQLKPRLVLSHVINGETSVSAGVTITAINDGSITSTENIGLMAEGWKNPSSTTTTGTTLWQYTDYEIVNDGTIDFSNSDKSVAIYANSARIQNNGTIRIGSESTGIYGKYKSETSLLYSPTATNTNKLELTNTGNSLIEIVGSKSVGIYTVDAEKIDNQGGQITSKINENVGIYAENTTKILSNFVNNTSISLADDSVGIYSKGIDTNNRNVLTNNASIVVGAKENKEKASVAIYAENTNVTNTGDISVGKDGIAFYGKNSDITVTAGTINLNSNGVLAYLEDSTLNYQLNNLNSTNNTMIYLKNSVAKFGTTGNPIDMTVADNYTGVYIEGNSSIEGLKNITLGKNSTGIYAKNSTITVDVENIVGTQDKAKGLIMFNSTLTDNKSNITLSGNNSLGIYSKNESTTTLLTSKNTGNIDISGDKSIGVYLEGAHDFTNTGDIDVAVYTSKDARVIGIYEKNGNSNITHEKGNINVGAESVGIYSDGTGTTNLKSGTLKVKDQGTGIYKNGGNIIINGKIIVDDHVSTVINSEPTAIYAINGVTIDDQSSQFSVGAKSYGIIMDNNSSTKNTYTNSGSGTISLGDSSTYLYSAGNADITNNKNITSVVTDTSTTPSTTTASNNLTVFYVKDGGNFTNNGKIDLSEGLGNVGVYSSNSTAINTRSGNILVGKSDYIDLSTGKPYSDINDVVYSIGMVADNGGSIINEGTITVSGNRSIGMYGSGSSTTVTNDGTIVLDGSNATSTDKIQSMTGVYVDNGAKFVNNGTIKTNDSYAGRDSKVNTNVSGLVGVAVINGSTLENHGDILIDANNSYGVIIRGERDSSGNVVKYALLKNYGTIKVRGVDTYAVSKQNSEIDEKTGSVIEADTEDQKFANESSSSMDVLDTNIQISNNTATYTLNGESYTAEVVDTVHGVNSGANMSISDIGVYIDTLGNTNPIHIDVTAPLEVPINTQFIIGTEYSELTNSKRWLVKDDVIKPFLDEIQSGNYKVTTLAGSLTWDAIPVLNSSNQITAVIMQKINYSNFVFSNDNAYNFADGLEQRYGVDALGSIENQVFQKLNSIGNNEEVLLAQAYDEMMGHQYANTQQRIVSTGRILNKEFDYLRSEWGNPTKESNKMKLFGTKEEYRTDTAGVIDYNSKAYGVAYVHENETIKLGNSSGWYAGYVFNRFDFKDIGESREDQHMIKAGLFKTTSFDDNGSLRWTISGEGFVGLNEMNRRFLVVDEIFGAKSNYTSYGVGLTNRLSKEIRTSERTSITPYGQLALEYGRYTGIKEDRGEIRLELKDNDYYSIRPEVGVEFKYRQPMAVKTQMVASLGLGYENELGQLSDVDNKAKVRYTTADYFTLRGDKEDRRGNFKADFKLGIENQIVGLTFNTGYDTKGENFRLGIGLKAIF